MPELKHESVKPWLLMMDLDGTVWDHLDISSVVPPYNLVQNGSISNVQGIRINVFPQAVSFIEWARRHGAITCTLSWNYTDYVMQALSVLGLIGLFDYHETEFSPDKDRRIIHLLEILKAKGIEIPPERIVYVDDRDIHISDIRRNVGNVLFIHIWKSVRDYSEAKRLIEENLLIKIG